MLMKLDKFEYNGKKNHLQLSNVYCRSRGDLLDLCDLYGPFGRGMEQFLSIFQLVNSLSLCVFVYAFGLHHWLLGAKPICINLAERKSV